MSYTTPHSLRTALKTFSATARRRQGVSLDRLRRRVVFERIVARL